MIDVLAGILSGADTPIFPGYSCLQNGVFMLALDVTFFRPAEEYNDAAETLFGALEGAQPAQGFEQVLLPGDVELQYRTEREQNGIAVDEATWTAIKEAAAKLGICL